MRLANRIALVATMAPLLVVACGPSRSTDGDGSPADAGDTTVVTDATDTTARDVAPDIAPTDVTDAQPDAMPDDVPADVPSDGPPADGSASGRGDVHVIITADNAYGFGYGSVSTMMNYFGGVENTTAGEIFNCPVGVGAEEYVVPRAMAPSGAFLYIISWSDMSVSQGVIAQFRRTGDATTIYTGDARFQVCATGMAYTIGSHGPNLDAINAQIAICNAMTGDPHSTSAGWVNATGTTAGALAIGEDNTTTRTSVTPGNEFPVACGIDAAAHWMWFNWDPTNIHWPTTTGDPFIAPAGAASTNAMKEFLIFRLAADAVPCTAACL